MGGEGYAVFTATPYAGAETAPANLRPTRFPPTEGVRFLLKTSGTSQTSRLTDGTTANGGKWIALSDANILSVINAHLPRLGLVESDSRVLSVLPWSHAFGLIIDLLPAIFAGAEIHRDAHGGRDIPALLGNYTNEGITDCCMVPLVAKRLMETTRGRDFLRSLRGGVVGGAPIDDALTDFLRTTNLRVGYGQTEASPGIALGEPGHFPAPRYLGKPLGCETRVDETTGTLHFRGENACVGTWNPATGYAALDTGDWRDTGDIVTSVQTQFVTNSDGDLIFHGRADAAFKLANGRRIDPEPLETTLRAAFAGVRHALVCADDTGESLTVLADVPLMLADVRAALGGAGKLVSGVRVVPVSAFVVTAKGDLNRAATLLAV